MDIATGTIYDAWKGYQGPDAELSEEEFEANYIGRFYGYEALAEEVLYDTGIIETFDDLVNRHPLASYYRFDYQMYGRDLELNGDVYSIEIDGNLHYFWAQR